MTARARGPEESHSSVAAPAFAEMSIAICLIELLDILFVVEILHVAVEAIPWRSIEHQLFILTIVI